MKKINLLLLALLTLGLSVFGQNYDEDKTITGLDVSTSVLDSDYTIIQKQSDTKVTAIRMDSIKSYMVEGMTADIPVLDSVSGETGQFIISDGVGWLAPVSAKCVGYGAYNFGYRYGSPAWGSIVLGGSSNLPNLAEGILSLATGQGTTASGRLASTFGFETTASGKYASSFGNGTTASGEGSTAFGNSSVASGDYSSSEGISISSGIYSKSWYSGIASGIASTAWGRDCEAIGDMSTAVGYKTYSNSYNEFTIGRYNDTAVTTFSRDGWNVLDRLFTIGNGTSSSVKSNALVMLKNGNTTATGDWTIEGDLEADRVTQDDIWHVVGGFENQSNSIDLTEDVWAHITNSTNDLWGNIEIDGFAVSDDMISCQNTADYTGSWVVTFTGTAGTVYRFRLYNATTGSPIAPSVGATGDGSTDYVSVMLPIYASGLAANDEIYLQVQNIDNDNDITVIDGFFVMYYLHN